MKIKLLAILVCVLFGISSWTQAAEPLRVFIRGGVKTHGPNQHDHPRFLGDWTKLLGERGLKVDGAMKFPTAEQLDQTDVVVIYAADGMKIVGAERESFEKFLRRGGGLVVIHDGVVSADQHEWAKKVQGGAWVWQRNAPGTTPTKWYEGDVGLYFMDTQHPITRGLSNFDWKDEIYYDLDMASDAKVLATSFHSVFVIAPQLWTYEKTWDGGTAPYRAFVSLPGHEYDVFETPHYRAILLRGIAWAGKRANVDEFCKSEELSERALKYPPGGPTAPDLAAQKLNVHPDFKINLVASEPLIEKAISLDWDAQGRLWVAETPEYPGGRTVNQNDKMIALWAEQDPTTFKGKKVDRPAKDRISWLEDTNGDGVMDRKQIFADHEHGVPGGLELVTSLVSYKDGVIVAQAPDILWLRDTNGDGVCDKVEKILTGFGTTDTHAVINNFRWGMDGFVYGACGYSGGDPRTPDGKSFGKHNSAIFRFKPDGSAFEVLASTACNTWGFDFGWDGELYYSTPTCGDHALHIVLPERILARGQIGGLRAQNAMQDHNRVKPAVNHKRPAYVQIDVVGGFTAASGACLYNGGAWPEAWNNQYFVSEPTVSLVHNDVLSPKGASYVASKDPSREDSEFIAGTDLWFRPIHQRVGPDGALYLLDFYNQAAIHNDTRGPKHGANNAATRPDRDHHFARIWRIQHKAAKALPKANLSSKDAADLVKALEHPNGEVRMTANRLLTERADAKVAPALARLAKNSDSPAGRLHALWVLNNLGKLDAPLLMAAAKDSHAAVRKNALRIVAEQENNAGDDQRKAVQAQLHDSDPRARLQALVALGSFTPTPDLAKAVTALWPSLSDRYEQSAAIGVAARDPVLFVEAVLAAKQGAAHEAFVRHVVRQLALKGDAAQSAKLITLLAQAPAGSDVHQQVALESLAANLKADVTPVWNAGLQSAFAALLKSPNPAVPGAALPLIARWDRAGSMTGEVKPLISQLETKLTDASLGDEVRGQVAANLVGVRQLDATIIPAVGKLLNEGTSPALQRRVIEALGDSSDAAASRQLIAAYARLTPENQDVAFSQIVKRGEWSTALLKAIQAGEVNWRALGPASVHRLRTHNDKSVAKLAGEVIDALRGPEAKEKEQLISSLLHAVEKPGDLANGKKLYDQNCGVCHPFKGAGRNVAPDLTGMGVHGAHELLVHILDPNRVVEANYVAVSIETRDGESYDGIISSENRSSVKLRNATGDQEVRTADIKTRRSTGRSLMPEGFEALGAEALRDVIAYVSADDNKFRILDLSSAFTTDSTRGIYANRESTRESLLFRKFGIVKAGDVPFDVVHPSKTSKGNNLIVLKGRNGLAREYPQKVEVNVPGLKAGKLHILGNVGGWAWPFGGDDTKGTPVAKITATHADGSTESWTLTNGVHVVDYNGADHECPGSKKVDGVVSGGQVRLVTQLLKSPSPLARLTFESFNNAVAPTFVAVTAELTDGGTTTAGR